MDGSPWLIALLADPDTTWWAADAPWPPWQHEVAWCGTVEAATGTTARRFAVAGAPSDGGWVWQFAEESLAARRDRLVARCVDAMPESISITTDQLALPGPQFVYANRAFTALTGWDREEVIGMTPRLLQGPRTSREELDRLVACLTNDQPFSGGAVNYRKTGEEFWNEWTISAATERTGARYYVSMMRDVTESRVANHQVRAAATEWATIVDALEVLIVMTRDDGCIVRCNQAFADFLGLPFAQLIGQSLATVLFGDACVALPSAMYQRRATTVPLARLDAWIAVDGRPVSRDGLVTSWVHTIVNVTPSQQTAAQLERLAIATERARFGIAVLDRDGRVEYVNSEFARLARAPRDSLRHGDLHASPLLGLELIDAARALGRHVVRREFELDDAPLAVEVAVDRLTGSDATCTGFVVTAHDLTERERLWRIAEHASNLGNVGSWLGGLRHELGNPVNSVKMALTVLQSHLPAMSVEDVARYVQRALSELARVEYLLQTLKTFSLYESVRIEATDLRSFLRRFTSLIQPDLARSGISLVTEVDGEPMIRADGRALHQVLVNLVANAAEATRGGSGQITLGTIVHDRGVELFVRDAGVGMSAEQRERMFQPFHTTKPQGTGLGLVLVQRLMVAMGGEIQVASEKGLGTTVTLTFARAT